MAPNAQLPSPWYKYPNLGYSTFSELYFFPCVSGYSVVLACPNSAVALA